MRSAANDRLRAARRRGRGRAGTAAEPGGRCRTRDRRATTGAGWRPRWPRELAVATARLPERQREALALRELLALSYEQIAAVMGLDPAAVAPLLARARLRLRAELRGAAPEPRQRCARSTTGRCALATPRRTASRSPLEDDDWLLDISAGCAECETAHAAMLEASVCYRAWPT